MKTASARRSVWLSMSKFNHFVLVAIVVTAITSPVLLALVWSSQFEAGIKEQLSESTRLTLYLRSGTQDINELLHRIEAVQGTVRAIHQSGKEAHDEFRDALGDEAKTVLKGVSPEVFPATIKVTVTYEALADILAYEKLLKSSNPEIEAALYPSAFLRDTLPSIHRCIDVVKHVVWIVICLEVVGGICLLILVGWTFARSWRQVWHLIPMSAASGGITSALMLYMLQHTITQAVTAKPIPWWVWVYGITGPVVLSIGVLGLQALLFRFLIPNAIPNCSVVEETRGEDNEYNMADYSSTPNGNRIIQVKGSVIFHEHSPT